MYLLLIKHAHGCLIRGLPRLNLPNILSTVSYTHLDVYKRQQYRFALGVAETDDVICNTLGTFIGSISLLIAHGIKKYKEKAIKHDSNKT